jgi:Flp pilus assembly protein TadG
MRLVSPRLRRGAGGSVRAGAASAPTSARPTPGAGQSLVEFALVLTPLFLVLLGIIQFGFIFNSYVTLTNSAREGARNGTVYICDPGDSKDQNDLARNEAIRAGVVGSMNLLSTTSPRFANSGTWTKSGLVFTTGDLVVTYAVPSDVVDTDCRRGETIDVRATYHQDLIIPIVSNFLPHDAGGRLSLVGDVTMVIN